jgi:hypothetical protein
MLRYAENAFMDKPSGLFAPFISNEENEVLGTTITIVSYALALASVLNYNPKWRHDLERHLLTMLEA